MSKSNGWSNHQNILHAFIKSTLPNACSFYDVCLVLFLSFSLLPLSISKSPNFTTAPLFIWCSITLQQYTVQWCAMMSSGNFCPSFSSRASPLFVRLLQKHIISVISLFSNMYSLKCNSHCDTHNWYSILHIIRSCNHFANGITESFCTKVHTLYSMHKSNQLYLEWFDYNILACDFN